VFVVIVASDNIAEQVAFTPKDPRLDQTNHLGKERISRAGSWKFLYTDQGWSGRSSFRTLLLVSYFLIIIPVGKSFIGDISLFSIISRLLYFHCKLFVGNRHSVHACHVQCVCGHLRRRSVSC